MKVINRATLVLVLFLCGICNLQGQQLDETWTVTAGGQSVAVDSDGGYRIPNISSADQFGAGGPGSAPDFLSDEYLRLTAVGTFQGEAWYAYSSPFKVAQGQTRFLSALTFTPNPPPIPLAIEVVPDLSSLVVGDQTTARVTGTLLSGALVDVTGSTNWTTYMTSNPNVAAVQADGSVYALNPGIAFITAVNEGATSVASVSVASLSDPRTTICGFVWDESGAAVSGATVSVLGLPESFDVLSGPSGEFRIFSVPTIGFSPYTIRARLLSGLTPLSGSLAGIVPMAGGITDVGVITVSPNLIENGDFETGDLTGFSITGNASIVASEGAILPPDGTYMARISTEPEGEIGRLTIPNILIPSSATEFSMMFNFMTNELSQGAGFNDVFDAVIMPESGEPIQIVRVTRDDMLSGAVPNLPGSPFEGMTGFLTATANVSSLAGTMISLDFCFTVSDVGDTGVETVVLLDLLSLN